MINNTTLVGRMTKSPELRYTNSGIAVLSFTLAVERNFTNAQGERETDFINCVAWRGTAETLSKFAARGSLVGVTGSIQTRNYENNEGRTIYITEVLVDNFQMLEPKSVTDERKNEEAGASGGRQYQGQQSNQRKQTKSNENPFKNVDYSQENPFANNDDVTDIADDDLPF